jgi:hypothetical protein
MRRTPLERAKKPDEEEASNQETTDKATITNGINNNESELSADRKAVLESARDVDEDQETLDLDDLEFPEKLKEINSVIIKLEAILT